MKAVFKTRELRRADIFEGRERGKIHHKNRSHMRLIYKYTAYNKTYFNIYFENAIDPVSYFKLTDLFQWTLHSIFA